ncbi:MAG: GNAT family N-acetyltransferase [Myxococcales bacterium]|nr:N-acetyltransferase [Polyangiaceae bacterium]MDW8248442.1 GNAT family N-acetyltransferase [Myxococcales bacterium]
MSWLMRASEEQKQERDRLTWSAWGANLTLEQFCRRERVLRAHPWAVHGMNTWLWVDESGAVLSSCESFACTSVFRGLWARSYAIASVFTEEKLRGQGHASRMMDALVLEIRRHDPLAHAVVLYSDVGKALYERSGFLGLPAWDVELDPCEGDVMEGVDELLPELVPELPPPPAEEPFVIWPDRHQMDWHRARERFYGDVLGRARSLSCGARVGRSQIYWTADFKQEQLLVLLVTEPEWKALERLLVAARRMAHRLRLTRVLLWEDASLAPFLAGLSGARRRPRHGALPMILPLQEGLRPEEWRLRSRALWV